MRQKINGESPSLRRIHQTCAGPSTHTVAEDIRLDNNNNINNNNNHTCAGPSTVAEDIRLDVLMMKGLIIEG